MHSQTSTQQVRVLVADDHPLYREGIARAFRCREGFEVVDEAPDGEEALRMVRRHRPDVAVLDVRMPGLPGIEVAEAIQREQLPTRVVLLSAYADAETVYRGLVCGAGTYLSKESPRERICDATARVARGELVLSDAVQASLTAEADLETTTAARPGLSARERQVLALTADGCSAPEIGRRLHVAPTTVKTHLKSLYRKLEVSDRAALVAAAMRGGLLD